MRKIIGVTGGLASGKTTVSAMFKELGAAIIDADRLAHDLLRKDEKIKRDIFEVFGPDIMSGNEVDRKKLAAKVFYDRKRLDMLCRIMHPGIIFRIKETASAILDRHVIVDAPLLIESGLNEYVDIVIVISCREDVQVERAIGRGISAEEAKNIIAGQMPLDQKIKYADNVIENNADLESVKKGVERLWLEI